MAVWVQPGLCVSLPIKSSLCVQGLSLYVLISPALASLKASVFPQIKGPSCSKLFVQCLQDDLSDNSSPFAGAEPSWYLDWELPWLIGIYYPLC